MNKIKLGIYKHSKSNKLYEVIGIGRNSETLEELVIYKALYSSSKYPINSIWLRPIKMFLEKVELDNKLVSRFEFLK